MEICIEDQSINEFNENIKIKKNIPSELLNVDDDDDGCYILVVDDEINCNDFEMENSELSTLLTDNEQDDIADTYQEQNQDDDTNYPNTITDSLKGVIACEKNDIVNEKKENVTEVREVIYGQPLDTHVLYFSETMNICSDFNVKTENKSGKVVNEISEEVVNEISEEVMNEISEEVVIEKFEEVVPENSEEVVIEIKDELPVEIVEYNSKTDIIDGNEEICLDYYEEITSSQLEPLTQDTEYETQSSEPPTYDTEYEVHTDKVQGVQLFCFCGQQFQTVDDSKKHFCTKNTKLKSENEFFCEVCGKNFKSLEILTGHILLHNESNLLIMCPFCSKLLRRSTLILHIKYNHTNKQPICNICSKVFSHPQVLKTHMTLHADQTFECDICFKKYSQEKTMQNHRERHKQLTCTICQENFNTKSEMKAHKIDCIDRNKAIIEKVTIDVMEKLKQKILIGEEGNFTYACLLCKKLFDDELSTELHIKSIHQADLIDLECRECGVVLTSKVQMHKHVASHKKISRRLQCSFCNKIWPSWALLKRHELVHTNERPYSCSICLRSFQTKTHLRTHNLTHTGEKNFGCAVCYKFFAQKGNLTAHMRIHTGEKPHECDICERAFAEPKYLKRHKLKKHGQQLANSKTIEKFPHIFPIPPDVVD